MKVKDVMHKGAASVEPHTTIQEVAQRMRENDVGSIPVKEDGHVLGIITDRDIICRAIASGANVSKTTAKEIMTKNVMCCTEDDDIKAAIHTMETKKIRRMPVVDDHKTMIGMVSLGDISHKVGKELAGEVLRAVSAHHA